MISMFYHLLYLPVGVGVLVPFIFGADCLMYGGFGGFVVEFYFPHFVDGGVPSWGGTYTDPLSSTPDISDGS